ncbi:MAG: hypothetical protein EOO22_00540 [Comamonadaceae bacterium]|nr:MAG: hypothetical protein EOO22_00540 [Comamonadaceae bacterium]
MEIRRFTREPLHALTGLPASWPLPTELSRHVIGNNLQLAARLAGVNTALRRQLRDFLKACGRIPCPKFGQNAAKVIKAIERYWQRNQQHLRGPKGTPIDLSHLIKRHLRPAFSMAINDLRSIDDQKKSFNDAAAKVGSIKDPIVKRGAFAALCGCFFQLDESLRDKAFELLLSHVGDDPRRIQALAAALPHLPPASREPLCILMFNGLDKIEDATPDDEAGVLKVLFGTLLLDPSNWEQLESGYDNPFGRFLRLPESLRLAVFGSVALPLITGLESDRTAAHDVSDLVERLVDPVIDLALANSDHRCLALCYALQLSVCYADEAEDAFVNKCESLIANGGVEHIDHLIVRMERIHSFECEGSFRRLIRSLDKGGSLHHTRVMFMLGTVMAGEWASSTHARTLQAIAVPADDAATALAMARWLNAESLAHPRCKVSLSATFLCGLLQAARQAQSPDKLPLLEAIAAAVVTLHRRVGAKAAIPAYIELFTIADDAGAAIHDMFLVSQTRLDIFDDRKLMAVLADRVEHLSAQRLADVITGAPYDRANRQSTKFVDWLIDRSCRSANGGVSRAITVLAAFERVPEQSETLILKLARRLLDGSRAGSFDVHPHMASALNAWVLRNKPLDAFDVSEVAFKLETDRVIAQIKSDGPADMGSIVMLSRYAGKALPGNLFELVDRKHADTKKRGLSTTGRLFYLELVQQLAQPLNAVGVTFGQRLDAITEATRHLPSAYNVLHAMLHKEFPVLDKFEAPESKEDRQVKLDQLEELLVHARGLRDRGDLSAGEFNDINALFFKAAKRYSGKLKYRLHW